MHTRECPSILIIRYPQGIHTAVFLFSLSPDIQHLCFWSASLPCHTDDLGMPIADTYIHTCTHMYMYICIYQPHVWVHTQHFCCSSQDHHWLHSPAKPCDLSHPVLSYRWYCLLLMRGSRDILNFAVLATRGYYSYLDHTDVTHSHCNPSIRFHLVIISTSRSLIILLGQGFLVSIVGSMLIWI